MIDLAPPPPVLDVSQHAGTYRESVCIDPPPSYLPLGAVVRQELFPELFEKLGHRYTSGTYVGDGTENGLFRLPDAKGRFLMPAFDPLEEVGEKLNDALTNHIHQVALSSESMGNHTFYPLPGPGSSYGDGLSLYSPGNGTVGPVTYTSTYAGDHNHSLSFGASGDIETRPANVAYPTYIHSGRSSDTAVLMVPGGGWISCPGYNSPVPNFMGLAAEFAKENIHVYRCLYRIATAETPSFPYAVDDVIEHLSELRGKYRRVCVLASSAGANLAALALAENPHLADRFVGLYGVYDLNGEMSPNFHGLYTDIYLGSVSQEARAAASPKKLKIPSRFYHGEDDVLVPFSQSLSYGEVENTTILPNFQHGSNIVQTGHIGEVIEFFKE